MSTQQHHARVLERFGEQAAALDIEGAKADSQAHQLGQLIATGQQQRAQVAAEVADLERRLQDRRARLTALDEDLAAKQSAMEDSQRDAVDYREEAAAVRAIVSRESTAALDQQRQGDQLVASASAIETATDPVRAGRDGAQS